MEIGELRYRGIGSRGFSFADGASEARTIARKGRPQSRNRVSYLDTVRLEQFIRIRAEAEVRPPDYGSIAHYEVSNLNRRKADLSQSEESRGSRLAKKLRKLALFI